MSRALRPPRTVGDVLQTAVRLHRAGDLAGAGSLYESVLSRVPGHVDALYLSGVVAVQSGRMVDAVRRLEACARAAPGHGEAPLVLGNALQNLGRLDEAVAAYGHALRNRPAHPAALNNLAAALIALGRTGQALAPLRALLAFDPGHAGGWNNLGVARLAAGDAAGAEAAFGRALVADPADPAAWSGLADARIDSGMTGTAAGAARRAVLLGGAGGGPLHTLGHALSQSGALPDALRAWRRAAVVDPADLRANAQTAILQAEGGQYAEAAATVMAPVVRTRTPGVSAGASEGFRMAGRTKLLHTAEQLGHLVAAGRVEPRLAAVAAEAQALADRVPAGRLVDLRGLKLPPSPSFLAAFNRLHYVAPAPAMPGGVLNPALPWREYGAAFAGDGPSAVRIDDLLKPEAHAALRRFCMESTVWFQTRFADEVGGRMVEGLCCPLIFQLAAELRQAVPALLADLSLRTVFGYVYYQHERDGHLHADQGIVGDRRVVSLNYWLTPADANADPASGGLWVWNKRAPSDYFRATEDEAKAAILGRLVEQPDARASYVPYAGNRAMLFRADVLHKSERMAFKPGLENRRISLTFVFGARR